MTDPATFEHLFRPLAIGPVELPNRIVSTSHQTTLVADHLVTDDLVAYHEARARGGVGLIVMEAVAVAPSGLLTSHTLGGYLDEMIEGYGRIAEAVHRHGTPLFVQLFHGGREVIAAAPRPVVVSASATPSARYRTEPRALRTEEIAELVADYGRCAAVAAAAGLDGVEITAAHGYLIEQFLRPELNQREDRYGDPGRFLLELVEEVRRAAPGLALGVRLSADSEAARAIAPGLAALVDFLHVAVGDSSTVAGCSGIAPPPPAPRALIGQLTAPFHLGPPLLATTRIVEPREAEDLLRHGLADAAGMTRALIADPDLPRSTRASGSASAALRCIGANACIAHYHSGTPIRCAQNPRTGRERTLFRPTPGATRRRVVVIGSGPAGLAAAAEARGAGDEVILVERAGAVGGQIALAGAAPALAELASTLLANYAQLLPAIELRLGATADASSIMALAPDLVIVATGARPFAPRQPLDGLVVLQAWDVLAGARPSGRIVIADWGGDSAALDCAELLAAEGREVVLAVGAVTPGETLHQYTRNGYLARLARAGVRLEQHLGLRSATGGTIRFANVFAPEIETAIEAEALVVSLGRTPDDGLAGELGRAGVPFVEAGDCRSPRGLEEAILEGTLAAGPARA